MPAKKRTGLRAVTPGEKPPAAKKAAPKRPATIKAAVEQTERELLVALRQKVAAEIDAGVPAHTLAPLMKQLRELDKEIRSLDARANEPDSNDDKGEADDEAFDPAAV